MPSESDFIKLQHRVSQLEKKLKSWGRIFKQEVVWKHNLEEWLLQHFDYNIRLKTEKSFFDSSDDEDCTANNLLEISDSRKASTSNLFKSNKNQSLSIDKVYQINPAQTVSASSFLHIDSEPRTKKYKTSSLLDNCSTNIHEVRSVFSTSNSHPGTRSEEGIISITDQRSFETNALRQSKPMVKNAIRNNGRESNETHMQNVEHSNDIILQSHTSRYEFEVEEAFDPDSIHREEEVAGSSADSDYVNGMSDEENSRSSSVIVLNHDEITCETNYNINKTRGEYTHCCVNCGRRVASEESPNLSNVPGLLDIVCFVCELEQLQQQGYPNPGDLTLLHSAESGKIEVWPNSDVNMDSRIVKTAAVKLVENGHWSESLRLLIRKYFPAEVLVHSNAKGGERKIPGGTGERHVPLDIFVVSAFKNFVKRFWNNKGCSELEVDRGFNRIINKVCQRERDKRKRKQMIEESDQ